LRVVFSPEAAEDLRSAIQYLAERNAQAATRLAERVFEATERLSGQEFEGAEQILGSGERVRSWPVPPLRVYYQRGGDVQGSRILRSDRIAEPTLAYG
jgi:plasmid stabilization system protein ParE